MSCCIRPMLRGLRAAWNILVWEKWGERSCAGLPLNVVKGYEDAWIFWIFVVNLFMVLVLWKVKAYFEILLLVVSCQMLLAFYFMNFLYCHGLEKLGCHVWRRKTHCNVCLHQTLTFCLLFLIRTGRKTARERGVRVCVLFCMLTCTEMIPVV